MILNFYKWLLIELEKEGYSESDIVLFQNAMTDKLYPMDVVKRHLNKDISVSYEKRDLRDLIVVTGPMLIHLSDGTIVEYSNDQENCHHQEYGNWLIYYFSAQRLLAKETLNEEKEPVIGLVLDEGYKSFSRNRWFPDDYLLNQCPKRDTVILDVEIRSIEEVQDFYILANKQGTLLTLDTETSKLYISAGTIKEADVDNVIAHLIKLPMIINDKLLSDMSNKFNDLNSIENRHLIYFDSDVLISGLIESVSKL